MTPTRTGDKLFSELMMTKPIFTNNGTHGKTEVKNLCERHLAGNNDKNINIKMSSLEEQGHNASPLSITSSCR